LQFESISKLEAIPDAVADEVAAALDVETIRELAAMDRI